MYNMRTERWKERLYRFGRRVSDDRDDAVSFIGSCSENGVAIGFGPPPLGGVAPVTFVFDGASSNRRGESPESQPVAQPWSPPHAPKTPKKKNWLRENPKPWQWRGWNLELACLEVTVLHWGTICRTGASVNSLYTLLILWKFISPLHSDKISI